MASIGTHMEKPSTEREDFVKSGLALSIISVAGLGYLSSSDEENEKNVPLPEDLMQEHGLADRLLLIYDYCHAQLCEQKHVPIEVLAEAANIMRSFVEDYQEKQEENYLFPKFEKTNQQVELIKILRLQHDRGRTITSRIQQLTKEVKLTADQKDQLIMLLYSFNIMYRSHKMRENNILLPAFKKIVSKQEYDSLGEEFESNEKKRFGVDGFGEIADRVSVLEKRLGIYGINRLS